MNQNAIKIEALFNDVTTAAEWATAPIAGSITWSFVNTLANLTSEIRRSSDAMDPFYGDRSTLSPDEKAERILKNEHRVDELLPVISYFASMASDKYLPDGKDFTENAVLPRQYPDITDVLIKATSELLDITVAEAKQAIIARQALDKDRDLLFIESIARDKAGLAALIDRALHVQIPEDFDLNDQDAARAAQIIGNKCMTYKANNLGKALGTRQASRQMELIAESKVLKAVGEEALELAAQLTADAKAQGPDSSETGAQG